VIEEKKIIDRVVDRAAEEGVPKEIARGIVEGNWDEWKQDLHSGSTDQEKIVDLLVKEVKKIYLNAINSPIYVERESETSRNPYIEHFPIYYSQSGLSRRTTEGLAAIAKDLDYEIGQINPADREGLLAKIKDLMKKAKDMENPYALEWLETLMNELMSQRRVFDPQQAKRKAREVCAQSPLPFLGRKSVGAASTFPSPVESRPLLRQGRFHPKPRD